MQPATKKSWKASHGSRKRRKAEKTGGEAKRGETRTHVASYISVFLDTPVN